MVQVKKSLIRFFFLLLLVTLAAGQPSFPQQFEGNVDVNGDQSSDGRTIFGQVGDGEMKEASVDSSGEYRIALSGEDGSKVSFYTENATGGMVEASTRPENPDFESGDSSKTVDLDFSIEKPEPRVITGEVIELGEDYAVLSARTRFVESSRELFFEYSDGSRRYDSESIEAGSGQYEIRVEDLDYDTEYSYTVYLDGGNQINGSTKNFETDNRPSFKVEGQTNLENGYVEAWINGENVKNESLDGSGDFRFEIDYSYSRSDEYVDVRVRDREKTQEYVSGETSQIEFEFEEVSSTGSNTDQDNDIGQNDESTRSDSVQQEENVQDEETNEQDNQESSDPSQIENSSEEQDNFTTQNSRNPENQRNSPDFLTGEFYQGQVNGTTVLLIIAIIGVGAYTGREYLK